MSHQYPSEFYTKTNWKNEPDTSTPLGQANLNHIEQGIKTADERIYDLDGRVGVYEDYEDVIVGYKNASQASAQAAATSESNAGTSATASANSATASANSASYSASSASDSASSANDAHNDAINAATSAANALSSEQAAATSESNAATSESNASSSATAASNSATAAASSASNASASEANASASETAAATSESNAENFAILSESYTKGGTNTRQGEDTDNAKYYKEQAQQIADNFTIDNETPTFTQSSTRTNINSGETISTIMGKIKKFFADLKTVAFTGSYNDLSDKPEHLGHSIKDTTTTFTDRANLKFTGSVAVTDDSTNDTTEIEILGTQDHVYSTKAEMNADLANVGEGETMYTLEDSSALVTRVENIETDIANIQDDVEDLQDDVTTINSNLTANSRASEVNITNYGASNKYVAPYDGYVQLRCVGSGYAGQVEIDDANDNYLAQIMISTDAGNGIQSIFVRKGMKIFPVYLAGGAGVSFRGLS